MAYLAANWSFDPFIVLVAILVIWHEAGLARLARRSQREPPGPRRVRSIWFYAGLAIVSASVASPISHWAGAYFFIHVAQQLLLMFAAPALLVAGAPWEALRAGLPGRLGAWSRPTRAVAELAVAPRFALVAFNAVMLIWYWPPLFDLAARNSAVRIWLSHGSYVLAGTLFWLQFIPSAPLRTGLRRTGQIAALLVSDWVMWLLAMSMTILTSGSWYRVYDHVPGVTLAPIQGQRLGGLILWISGFFWAGPTLNYVIRRMLAEDQGDGVSALVDRLLGRS